MNGYDWNECCNEWLRLRKLQRSPDARVCGGGGGVGERENQNSIDCLNPFGGNKMLFLKIAPQR